jgi:hypothetical protein
MFNDLIDSTQVHPPPSHGVGYCCQEDAAVDEAEQRVQLVVE